MIRRCSVLLTGATGFVGGCFLMRWSLSQKGELRVVTRSQNASWPANVIPIKIDSKDRFSKSLPLQGVDVVVHCAARAHIMKDEVSDPLAEYRKVNVEGTLNLAQQAA